MKLVALLLASCVTLMAGELRRLPPIPGEPVKASLSDVQSAIRTLVALDVAVTLQSETNHAERFAYHFRAIADVFARMTQDGTFSVEHLTAEIGKILLPPEIPATQLYATQSAILAVYGRCYQHRGRASIPPLEFLSQISKSFEAAIREGIQKGGKAHVLL